MRANMELYEKQEVKNLRHAVEIISRRAGGGFTRTKLHTGNPNFRDSPVGVVWVYNGHVFYVTLKRGPLGSFSKLYPKEAPTVAQTMNLAILKQAADIDAMILIVTANSVVYGLAAREWLSYANKHGTIRTPSTEETEEASVPIRMLCRQNWLSPRLER